MRSILQNHIVRHYKRTHHLAITFKKVSLVLFLVLGLLTPILYTRMGGGARVYAAPNSEINFQARLTTASGALVPDANTYNVEFKLYSIDTGGTAVWTESQIGMTVKNGYLSVGLGSVTPFPGSINWSDELWLTMNVNSDGEMSPRLKLTGVPLAFRARQADGLTNGASTLTANDLAQLAPASAQVINSALAALRLNQTGAGGLLQLQNNGSDVFGVSSNGTLTSSGSAIFSGGTLNLGTATQTGGLVLHNGSAKTGTIQTGTLSANRTYTLPDADGTICLVTTCTGGGGGPTNAFVQDGNTFGAVATLGTNDVFGLAFETSGLQRILIDAGGNVGIGTSGTPSQLLSIGGTTGNFTVNGSGSVVAADLTSNGALTVVAGGANITGGLNNNGGGITNTGNITGVGTNITAVAGLNIASGGVGDLALTSASGLLVLGASTVQAADNLALDLTKATDTTLTLQNSGTGISNLNLLDGGLFTGGTQRVSNSGALQNITGLSVISGGATINGNTTLGGSTSDRLTITSQLLGANPLAFQGLTDDAFVTTLSAANPTANNTITLPNGSGTLLLDTRSVLTAVGSGLSGGGDLSVNRSLSLDINGITSKTAVNMDDFLAVYDSATASTRKISRADFLQGVLGAVVYRGTWDASTNTPTLAHNTGIEGHQYAVSVAGSQNFGSGPSITFGVGDLVIHNGTKWERVPTAAAVTSVFGRTGSVTAQNGDYTGLQITNTPAGNIAATTIQGAINELNNEKLGSLNGLTAISQTFVNDTNVTVTSAGSTHTFGWAGQLSVARGGTGTNTFTPNGVLYGNGTSALQVSAAGTSGQLLIANASGVPTFVSLSGDLTVSSTGVTSIGANAINLTTDTVGNYVANLGTLTGLTTTGNIGEGSTPTLAVTYGSLANTAVQGNTGLTVTAGTNLSGGGAITLGTGGTVTLNIIPNPTFGTSVTTPILTSTAGLSISSGGTSDITLDSASNKIIIAGTDTTLERTGAGGYTIDLKNNAATSLNLSNSTAGGSSVANLNLLDGELQIAGVTVIGSDRVFQNLAGLGVVGTFTTSGGIVSLNAGSNFATNINTGTSTGAINIGGGTAPLVINSTAFSVTAAGALSGITTINTSGLITSLGLTAGAGLVQGTGGLTFIGAISLNVAAGTSITNIGTGTTTGQITIGGGTAPLVINSTAFDVSATGGLSGITTIGLSGAITGATATNTINGLVINSGALSSVASITGSGALTIASGGAGALTLDSASNTLVLAGTDTTIQRTAAGTTTIDLVNAGTTTLTITNSNNANTANLNVEGLYQQNGTSGLATATCNASQSLNGINVRGGIITAGTCNNNLTDIAEQYNSVEDLEPGDVVAVDHDRYPYVKKTTGKSQADTLGIVSTAPYRVLGDANPGYPIALIGRVPTKVNLENGPIAPGDKLTSSSTPGVAMKATGSGQTIGTALQAYDGSQANNKIEVFVNLGWWSNPGYQSSSTTDDINAQSIFTNNKLRLDSAGALHNITGLSMVSGGASIAGGLNNNGGGVTNIGVVAGATTIDAQSLNLSASGTTDLLNLVKDGKGVFTVFNNGSMQLQLDSANIFAVKDASGVSVFNIDSASGAVNVGSGSQAKTVLFVLDNRSLPDDPPGVSGATYYNTVLQRFRCYEATSWQDCLPAGDLTEAFALSKVSWVQPLIDSEFPDSPRIVTNLSRANEFRLRMRIIDPGLNGSACRLQFAAQDDGPWVDLADSGKLVIDQAGTLKSDWLKIKQAARADDRLIRVMCVGGDDTKAVVFNGVSMQLR